MSSCHLNDRSLAGADGREVRSERMVLAIACPSYTEVFSEADAEASLYLDCRRSSRAADLGRKDASSAAASAVAERDLKVLKQNLATRVLSDGSLNLAVVLNRSEML